MAVITVMLALSLLETLLRSCSALSGGASPSNCTTLTPLAPHEPGMNLSSSPYSLDIPGLENVNETYYYTPGRTYTATLRGNDSQLFRGFLVQLQAAADHSILGQLAMMSGVNNSHIQPHMCSPSTGGLTQTSGDNKTSIVFQWTPRVGTGDVVFRYSVIQALDTHWGAASTRILRESAQVASLQKRTQVCNGSIILGPGRISWSTSNATVSFTVQAPAINRHYIAVGFSNNTVMPNSDIIVGAVDGIMSFVDDRWATMYSMPLRDNSRDISATSVNLEDGNMTMSFTRLLNTNDTRDTVLTNSRDGCVYFQFATGRVGQFIHHTIYIHTRHAVSSVRVCLCSRGIMTSASVWLWLLLAIASIQCML